MEADQVLVRKQYYKTLIRDEENRLQELGELYFENQKDPASDLAEIRFAQGEIYYHASDYESAVFKWENIQGELESWARKNAGDAYMKLELYDSAEGLYNSVTTDSLVLNVEVTLQLFKLYKVQKKTNEAKQMIQNALLLDPNYPNVTEYAREFFEEIGDWSSAIELAVNETIRTASSDWFHVINGYIRAGNNVYEPPYYSSLLEALYGDAKFEYIVEALWNSYRGKESYLTWLEEISGLLNKMAGEQKQTSRKLERLFEETFYVLLDGTNSFSKVKQLLPNFLEAWMSFTSFSSVSTSAVLAWNELFPGNISENTLLNAKKTPVTTKSDNEIQALAGDLLADIRAWAEQNDIDLERQNENTTLPEIRQLIFELAEQLEKMKNELLTTVEQDEDIASRVQGSVNQLQDLEETKAEEIRKTLQEIKEEIRSDLRQVVPKLVKETADLIKEDSDFRTIHLELNTEMNKKIQAHMEKTAIPAFKQALEKWIGNSKESLINVQEQLTEWTKGFNQLLGEPRINLECDFQIIEDWKRDIDRMTSSLEVKKENILLKRTPSQVLLKGAGKLFGAIQKNNTVLANAYRNFIENEKYDEVADSIANQLFEPFDLFERGIRRDIQLFVKEPLSNLESVVAEIQSTIQENQDKLTILKENPEIYKQTLNLFEVRVRQLELIYASEESNSASNEEE